MESRPNPMVASLPILPRHVLTRQNSSYNRSGINKDSGNFLYIDQNGEAVIFDAYGPGCIRSIFATLILNNPTIKFYFDGAATPLFSMPILDFFSGQHPQFPAPMVSDKVLGYYLGDDSRGGNCLLPMAFEHSLKITLSGNKDIFYHILWEQYPVGGGMTGEALAKSISAAQDIWLPPVPQKTAHPENIQQICLLPGKKVTFFETEGAACITSISIESGCIESLLKDVYLRIRWDDQVYDSVHAPLGHFFSVPAGPVALDTPLITVTELDEFTIRLVCRWPMPFWKKASLSLVNLGSITIPNIKTYVETIAQPYSAEDSGYFCCYYHAGKTEYGKDWTLAQDEGWGKYVGTVQMMLGEHYCEGDDHFYLDGSCTPQMNGTGTEDYYLFCFWSNPQLSTPYNGSTTDVYRKGGGIYENSYHFPSAYYRFHLDCPIAFYSSIDARIQHGGMSNIHSQYSSLAFCYMRKTPTLVMSDYLESANDAARQMHGYQMVGGEKVTTESSFIGNHINVRQRLSGYEYTGGEISFYLAVDPENEGVMLRRRIDQFHGRQKAEVIVDGHPAGTWYDANTNAIHRWHDSDFLVAPALCKGKSRLHITLKVQACEPGRFTDYGIKAYSFSKPAAALFDERQAILGAYADQLD
jgi:hypothetical protein